MLTFAFYLVATIILATIVFLVLVGQLPAASGKLMAVMGSGGHTGEMLAMVRPLVGKILEDHDKAGNNTDIKKQEPPTMDNVDEVIFVVTETDRLSSKRLHQEYRNIHTDEHHHHNHQDDDEGVPTTLQYRLVKIARSREVGQSWGSAVLSTIISLVHSLHLMFNERPALLLCNGPGVCLPLIIAARLVAPATQVVFIESLCRTRRLSLTGLLVYHLRLADHFLVQWPRLATKYTRSRYLGILV